MRIKPFAVEEWMNEYETRAVYNIAETCVNSVTLDELFTLTGTDGDAFFNTLRGRRFTYGDILGAPAFKEGICRLYRTITPDQVVTTHGAAGANHHVFYSLVEPGDRVISITPTYQQLYSIPESFGADLHILELKKENSYLPDLNELKALAVPGTKLICLNNPNNPTGALMDESMLNAIIDIAREAGAYILCDEVYRHLTQEDIYCPSIADLYEKGISVSSMSKVFSLAGLRLGWIASRDAAFIASCLSHRDYNHISCGMFDEAVAGVALSHAEALLARNRAVVRENLAILDAFIASEPHLSYVKPQAGTTALIYYDFDIDSYTFCKEMFETTGAFVTPGDCFDQPHCMRIGYACGREELEAGLKALSAFLQTKSL